MKLYMFIPVSVTLTYFQGHMRVWKIQKEWEGLSYKCELTEQLILFLGSHCQSFVLYWLVGSEPQRLLYYFFCPCLYRWMWLSVMKDLWGLLRKRTSQPAHSDFTALTGGRRRDVFLMEQHRTEMPEATMHAAQTEARAFQALQTKCACCCF